jgi:glycosyltransferase involved in cell wall biosynthesis
MKALFLYTELADYFIRCCEALAEDTEVHIVRWPVNPEAPFRFDIPSSLKIYERKALGKNELIALAEEISPNVIVCSGWVDRGYLAVAKHFSGRIPTVMASDTHWKGSLRQVVALVAARFFITRTFSHAWVPGRSQAKYARLLGFRTHAISTGFYCCDLGRFNSIYFTSIDGKAARFPRRIVYSGRYYEFKGVKDLWEAFISLCDETGTDWELWCLGVGDVAPAMHKNIKHFGFVQPADLAPILSDAGVFVLPSHFEPWAVVVHEFAAAGFPLLLSDAVGSREAFLAEGENGFSFPSGNVSRLKAALKNIINLSDKDLLLMARRSHEIAQRVNSAGWAQTVRQIVRGFRKK